jgi:surface antigen
MRLRAGLEMSSRNVLLMVLVVGLLSAYSSAASPQQEARNDVPDTVVQRALESTKSGQTTVWQDPATGAAAAVTPRRTFQVKGGRYCRDYALTYTGPDGRGFSWKETACRSDDDVWRRIDRGS